MSEIELAAELGFGIPWLKLTFTIAILIATSFFVYVFLSTRKDHVTLKGFDKLKYQLNKYHVEKYWAVFVSGILVWFWILGYPWMPPVAFERGLSEESNVHLIKITAGQWYWNLEDGGYINPHHDDNGTAMPIGTEKQIQVKAGETVKFEAVSKDVNHGFAILASSNQMDVPLMQMQVVPGYTNEFYYTFEKAGVYTIRCLEYCGWNHPFMTSSIAISA